MHRVLKEEGQVSTEAFARMFDPVRLFSGKREEIEKAADALYDDWAAASKYANLRVFVHGQKVQGDAQRQDVDHVARRIWPWTDGLRTALAAVLCSDKVQMVLAHLCHLQRQLDPVDVEGVARQYRAAYGKGLVDATEEEAVSLDEYRSVIEGADATVRQRLAQLLLSTSFKDCSLFLRCSAPTDEPRIDVHLVDLDPKPISKLPHLWTVDQDVVAFFRSWAPLHGLG